MFRKIIAIRPSAWLLLLGVTLLGSFSIYATLSQAHMRSVVSYGIQPMTALLLAIIAFWLSRGLSGHVRHAKDKAIIIGAVLAIWFVVYFMTGILLTYVHNALVGSFQGVLLNSIGFGLTAACLEYVRYRLLLMAGRRNVIWFGILVTAAFALLQMNLVQIADIHGAEGAVKLLVSDTIPAFVTSTLLTYLAITAGLSAALTYRLGIVAMTILPPILPKFDWYLSGIAMLLLAIIIYLVIDHTQQTGRQPHTRRHLNIAVETTWGSAIIALALFMTGVFAYKPNAIMSDSMKPVFARGSMVIIEKKTDKMDINIGDIIQYEAHGLIVTHRVISLDQASDGSGETIIITKGDNNPSRDEPVRLKNVVGTVKTNIPYIGYPTVWLRELTVGNKSNQVNK